MGTVAYENLGTPWNDARLGSFLSPISAFLTAERWVLCLVTAP